MMRALGVQQPEPVVEGVGSVAGAQPDMAENPVLGGACATDAGGVLVAVGHFRGVKAADDDPAGEVWPAMVTSS